jgi:hypothetical protein
MKYQSFHLTYCSNIHPGESWAEVWQNLQTYLPQLRSQLQSPRSPTVPFGIGLRLADQASRELLEADHLAEFKAWLEANQFYVFTLNGFPYGGFHRQVVKDQVYAPDWFTADRLAYTQRLITILAALLPPGMDGSISTLPISYKPWWEGAVANREAGQIQAVQALTWLTEQLTELETRTGQYIHLGLEPEPDGLIENSREVVDWFDRYLLPIGGEILQSRWGMTIATARQRLLRHIQVCYDTCHFAVEFEDPIAAIGQLVRHGIGLSKIQLSAALRFEIPADLAARQALQRYLQPFAESTYLHQVIARPADGRLRRYRDLEQALPELLATPAIEWRTHFHVPLFLRDLAPVSTTQADIQATLAYLQQYPALCHHLEIETYTWEVLPPELKFDLVTSIAREYRWVMETLVTQRREAIAAPQFA